MISDNNYIEQSVDRYILNSAAEFSPEETVKSLSDGKTVNKKELDRLSDKVERYLRNSECLLKKPLKNLFCSRRNLFKDAQLLIVPDHFEIEHGLLFPGHRFSAFCEADFFPSEVTLIDADSGQKFGHSDFSCPVTEVIPFHILLGSEQIFDFFVADHQCNNILLNGDPDGIVTLTVIDSKKFYAYHHFQPGDALLLTVKDWSSGIFSCEYIAMKSRSEQDCRRWIADYSEAMEAVIEDFGRYLEIPDQLSHAFYAADKKLLQHPAASLDEFYRKSEIIQISFSGGHTVLSVIGGENDFAADEDSGAVNQLPDGIMISKGETGSLEVILQSVGSPLTPVEIDAYILTQCYHVEEDFDAFFRRCFGNEPLPFADKAQEAVFMNYIEDRWEELRARYNRPRDEEKAPIRERILEIVDQRLEWFNYLREMEIDVAQLPAEKLKALTESALYLSNLLSLLNSEVHTLPEEEKEGIFEAVEDIAALQYKYMTEIKEYIVPE